MRYEDAIKAMKSGAKIARAHWEEKNIWIAWSPGHDALPAEKFFAPHNRAFAEQNGGTADVMPCITMKNASGKIQMGWSASREDMRADDWEILAMHA